MESIVHIKTDLNPPESVQKGDFSKGTAWLGSISAWQRAEPVAGDTADFDLPALVGFHPWH